MNLNPSNQTWWVTWGNDGFTEIKLMDLAKWCNFHTESQVYNDSVVGHSIQSRPRVGCSHVHGGDRWHEAAVHWGLQQTA